MSEGLPAVDEQFLRLGATLARYSISRSTWWRWVRDGVAPQPVGLGPSGTLFWRLSDLLAWEAKRGAAPMVRPLRGVKPGGTR